MRHFPIFLDLAGRTALVVGSGEVAARKAAALAEAGALVRERPGFTEADLDGAAIAIGADASEADLRGLAAAARRRCIPVNVVDRPELCSFITPSIIDRDPVTIAVGSAGTAPVLARLLRARIEAAVPPRFGALAGFAARIRDRVRAALPNPAARRRFLERTLTGPAADLVFAGDEAAAAATVEAGLTGAARAPDGIVFLVGAGPGAADLLTLRAQRLLGEADVIVHDRLVSEDVLAMARRDAERIYVGKARANHCLSQEAINALLVRLAREGRRVVRLKGGDPLVFGRGGEEAEALAAASIRYEIVPGVTAALAAGAQTGIPLTHRGIARSVTFATGHTKDGELDLDCAALARLGGTLAIYMGVATLPLLADGLIAAGLDPATPAALVESAGTPACRELVGTLDGLVRDGPTWSCGGPTLVLIGAVVGRAGQARSAAAEIEVAAAIGLEHVVVE